MRLKESFFELEDNRGRIFCIFKNQNWKELNFIETKEGMIRGEHYHKKTQEMVYVIDGEIELTIQNILTNEKNTLTLQKDAMVIIDPYELHTFKTMTDSRWINMLSIIYDHKNPDVFKIGN